MTPPPPQTSVAATPPAPLERTFWEKATAIHVYCAQGSFRGGARFARHWHDVTRLDAAGFADSAAADRELAQAVAAHKSIFFAESASDGTPIDYGAAVTGGLVLVPSGAARRTLADDYQRMVDDGLLMDRAARHPDRSRASDSVRPTLCGNAAERMSAAGSAVR